MNRPGTLIWGRNVQRHSCEHTECANLRQIRSQCAAANRWNLVNVAEHALARCSSQPGQEWVR
jgi:hypothetical protein